MIKKMMLNLFIGFFIGFFLIGPAYIMIAEKINNRKKKKKGN